MIKDNYKQGCLKKLHNFLQEIDAKVIFDIKIEYDKGEPKNKMVLKAYIPHVKVSKLFEVLECEDIIKADIIKNYYIIDLGRFTNNQDMFLNLMSNYALLEYNKRKKEVEAENLDIKRKGGLIDIWD